MALWLQIDQQRLCAQQEAATAAATKAAEATREASERRQRADEEVKAVRAMEEQSRAWLQRKEAELAAKLDAAAAAEASAEQKAQAAAAAAQEQQQELARSRQQLQAEEEALVPHLASCPYSAQVCFNICHCYATLTCAVSTLLQAQTGLSRTACAQVADRRKLQRDLAQLDAEREMLQVQQEECASQIQKASAPLIRVLHPEEGAMLRTPP